MKKYFKPKSLSWWSAVIIASLQVVRSAGVEIPIQVDGIVAGLFGIGMRGALEK